MGTRGRQPPRTPFDELITHARITNTLLAAQLLQHMTQQEVIGLLKGVGAPLQDIADILGTSYATVAVQSQRLQKKAAKRKGLLDAETETTPEVETAAANLREPGDGSE